MLEEGGAFHRHGETLPQLAQSSAFRRYRHGDVLLPAGAPATDAFLIITGRLAVTVPTGEGEIQLELIPSRELMVIQEMLAGAASPVRVVADQDTNVLAIPAQALVDAMDRNWVMERDINAVIEARRQAILPLRRDWRIVA
jgi:signal-transduction protein with cAMP-binding, CBS, and nucleotidyltransferase domain